MGLKWPFGQTRAFLSEALSEIAELRGKIESETAKRIAAERIAEERKARIEQLTEQATRTEQRYHDLVEKQFKSLDLVNTGLMNATAVQPTPEPSGFKAIPQTRKQLRPLIQRVSAVEDRMLRDLIAKKSVTATPKKSESK